MTASGIRCPECGGGVRHASVTDTRRGRDFIRRRRHCENGHPFTTHETVWVRPKETTRDQFMTALDNYIGKVDTS